MSDVVKQLLNKAVAGIEGEIAWRTDDLIHAQSSAVLTRTRLSELRDQRRQITDQLELLARGNA